MDVFELRRRVVDDYQQYITSFISISDPLIQEEVDRNLDAGLLWPEPRIGLNPSFETGGLIDEHVESGLLHAECSKIFRKKPDDGPEEALRDSLSILEKLGAGPLAAIVRQRLRDRGVTGIPRGPRASTRSNPAGLTAREVHVLRLLVGGHTNAELARRLHLSAKTVDHHVSSILEKLEVRSRTEAVAAAFGLGIVKSAGNGS